MQHGCLWIIWSLNWWNRCKSKAREKEIPTEFPRMCLSSLWETFVFQVNSGKTVLQAMEWKNYILQGIPQLFCFLFYLQHHIPEQVKDGCCRLNISPACLPNHTWYIDSLTLTFYPGPPLVRVLILSQRFDFCVQPQNRLLLNSSSTGYIIISCKHMNDVFSAKWKVEEQKLLLQWRLMEN